MALTAKQFADILKDQAVIEQLNLALAPLLTKLIEKEVQEAAQAMEIKLEQERQEHSKVVDSLREEIDQLKKDRDTALQYSFKNDIVIEGLKVRPKRPQEFGDENVLEAVRTLFNDELHVRVDEKDISAVHYLPVRKGTAKESGSQRIIVRFCNRRLKQKVYGARKSLKTSQTQGQVFINEHLTPRTAEIFFHARKLLKEKKIEKCWTHDCVVYTKVNNVIRKLAEAPKG